MEKYLVMTKNSTDWFIPEDEFYIFDTEEEAKNFIKKIYSLDIQDNITDIDNNPKVTHFDEEYHEGRITYINGEWTDYLIKKTMNPLLRI